MRRNQNLRFLCRDVYLKTERNDLPFTWKLPAGKVMRIPIAHSFGKAAAPETVAGVLAKLDGEDVEGEMRVRDVVEGRAEVVQMWGRPESVRREFRQRRSL